jgi:hypothetical protein
LTTDRADMLRQDMWAYVHAIADVVAAGQRDGVFVDIPPVTQTPLILSMCNGTTEWSARTCRCRTSPSTRRRWHSRVRQVPNAGSARGFRGVAHGGDDDHCGLGADE